MSRRFETRAHIALERTADNLFAHVELGVDMQPGDRFRLQGPPIHLGFGEEARMERTATVWRASPLRRAWTRFAAHFALTELYEVSFSGRSLP